MSDADVVLVKWTPAPDYHGPAPRGVGIFHVGPIVVMIEVLSRTSGRPVSYIKWASKEADAATVARMLALVEHAPPGPLYR